MDETGSRGWIPEGYNVFLLPRNGTGSDSGVGFESGVDAQDLPTEMVGDMSGLSTDAPRRSRSLTPNILPRIVTSSGLKETPLQTPPGNPSPISKCVKSYPDGLSRMECYSDEGLRGDSTDDDDDNIFEYNTIEPSLPWPWGRNEDSTVCQVCNACFLTVSEMVRHYLKSPCGSIFMDSQTASTSVSRISILSVSKHAKVGSSSDDLPPGGRDEINRLVRGYLASNGITDCSEDEDDKAKEQKVLEVVLNKIVSPEKVPRCKNSPLDLKLKHGDQRPKKKYRAAGESLKRSHTREDAPRDVAMKLKYDEDIDDDFEPERERFPIPLAVYRPGNLPRNSAQVSPLTERKVPSTKKRNRKPRGISQVMKKEKSGVDTSYKYKYKKIKRSENELGELVRAASSAEKQFLHSPRRGAIADSVFRYAVQHLCDLCDHQARSEADLQYHYGAAHQVSVCSKCQMKITDPLEFQNHVKTHVDYCCEQCEKTLASKLAYTRHVKAHGDGHLYECDVCNELFQSEQHLKSHLETHTAAKRRYICDRCPLGYSTKSDLKKHMIRHRYRLLNCGICGQACDSGIMLEIHGMTHVLVHQGTKSEKYECKVCHLRLSNSKKMAVHLNTHNEAKVLFAPKTSFTPKTSPKVKSMSE